MIKTAKRSKKAEKQAQAKKKAKANANIHEQTKHNSYARRKALSLKVNADILVAFLMSVLRELKHLGHCKLTEISLRLSYIRATGRNSLFLYCTIKMAKLQTRYNGFANLLQRVEKSQFP